MNPFFKALNDNKSALEEALRADERDFSASAKYHRKPLSVEEFVEVLNIIPVSRAIQKLASLTPVSPSKRYNNLLTTLNLVSALSTSFGARRGLGLIIDDGIGEEYDKLISVADEIGAVVTSEYLSCGRDACGGEIPQDEIERAELSEQFDESLVELDKKYAHRLIGEIESCFIAYLKQDIPLNLRLLNQSSKVSL